MHRARPFPKRNVGNLPPGIGISRTVPRDSKRREKEISHPKIAQERKERKGELCRRHLCNLTLMPRPLTISTMILHAFDTHKRPNRPTILTKPTRQSRHPIRNRLRNRSPRSLRRDRPSQHQPATAATLLSRAPLRDAGQPGQNRAGSAAVRRAAPLV